MIKMALVKFSYVFLGLNIETLSTEQQFCRHPHGPGVSSPVLRGLQSITRPWRHSQLRFPTSEKGTWHNSPSPARVWVEHWLFFLLLTFLLFFFSTMKGKPVSLCCIFIHIGFFFKKNSSILRFTNFLIIKNFVIQMVLWWHFMIFELKPKSSCSSLWTNLFDTLKWLLPREDVLWQPCLSVCLLAK